MNFHAYSSYLYQSHSFHSLYNEIYMARRSQRRTERGDLLALFIMGYNLLVRERLRELRQARRQPAARLAIMPADSRASKFELKVKSDLIVTLVVFYGKKCKIKVVFDLRKGVKTICIYEYWDNRHISSIVQPSVNTNNSLASCTGQMLVNWFVSAFAEDHYLRMLLSGQDLRILGAQYCTHLLAAGVLRQIPDKDAPNESIFRPDLMYYWAHTEAPVAPPATPGRIQTVSWPPAQDIPHNQKPPDQLLTPNSRKKKLTLQNLETPNKTEPISHCEGQKNANEAINLRLQPKELEFAQTNNKTTEAEPYANQRVRELEDLVNTLLRELDRYKTLVEIQSLTQNAIRDFGTPINEKKLDPKETSQLDKRALNNKENIDSFGRIERAVPFFNNDGVACEVSSENGLSPNPINSIVPDSLLKSYDELCPSNSEKKTFNLQKDDKSPQKSPEEEFSTSLGSDFPPPPTAPEMDYSSLPSLPFDACSGTLPPPLLEDLPLSHSQSEIPLTCDIEPPPPLDLDPTPSEPQLPSPPKIKSSSIGAMGPPPPPMPEMEYSVLETIPEMEALPSQNDRFPAPPPISDMIPPPPGMVEMVPPPPPPPMSGMEPSLPTISETGPPPPSISSMAPPPPPMAGMGPPPPPMSGMGPPPPPMSGMGPPPPPMAGMGPPPPPMAGMGPPPPPMSGMGPPPPPMAGMGPPPPPMSGMGPPPPPMAGMGPPPPPMADGGPPPPPMAPGAPPPPGSGAPLPPGMAPIPFPAPPVGGWNPNRMTMRKDPVNPTVPMKPLYWTRILAPTDPVEAVTPEEEKPITSKPLWLEIEETKLANIDEFADLFSRQVVTRKPTKKKIERPSKVQAAKILDGKRFQNVGILAQSLHVDFSEIEHAIYCFDTTVVNLEALQQIYEARATDEELANIKDHLKNNPDIPLDKPETFLLDLSEIQNFAERISCFTFQAEFDDSVTSITSKLDNIKRTCEFVLSNEGLKKLFAIILTLGNYMNGGNRQRGQADGFGLEILAKLRDVKSKDSSVTLLHFIVRTYIAQCEDGIGPLPIPEPGDIDRASWVLFDEVKMDLDTLQKQLNSCLFKTKKVIASSSEENMQPFKDKMNTFLESAEKQLALEKDNLTECHCKFITTMKFYQYSPRTGPLEDCSPKDFFSLWSQFCIDFKDIWKKEEQKILKEKLKEAKRQQEERISKIQKEPKKEGGLKARLQKLASKKSS